jgi:hypothetical protein
MKTKLFSLIVYFFLQFSISSEASIVFRYANSGDLEAILLIQRNYTEDDRERLVTFPIEVDQQILQSSILSKKLFLAEDSKNHHIISILKLFIIHESPIDSEADINKTYSQHLEILRDELQCLGDKSEQVLAEGFNSQDPLLERMTPRNKFEFNPEKQLFLYYGGAYTIPEARKKGVQTRLLEEALGLLKNELLESIPNEFETFEFILTYGQVLAAQSNKGMIPVFTSFVKSLINASEVQSYSILSDYVEHLGYRAFKPSFSFNPDKNNLEVHFPETSNGIGNLVIISLKGHHKCFAT